MRSLGWGVFAVIFAMAGWRALRGQPSAQSTAATLDRMTAGGKSRQELAQYVFDTHGCKSCHTAGQNSKLGFTERGRQIAKGFEGCIALLSAMDLIAQVPEERRSLQQQQKAARFEGVRLHLLSQNHTRQNGPYRDRNQT